MNECCPWLCPIVGDRSVKLSLSMPENGGGEGLAWEENLRRVEEKGGGNGGDR